MSSDGYGIIILVSGIVSLSIAFFVWRRRTVPETHWFALLMGAAGFWAVAGSFEIMSKQMTTTVFWAKAAYIPIVSVAPLWLLFALRQEKRITERFFRFVPFFWILPVTVIFSVWTNERHRLFWTEIIPIADVRGLFVRYVYGPVFWINMAYSYALILVGTLLLVRNFLRMKDSKAGFLLAAAAVLPWILNITYIFGGSLDNVDFTPAVFAFTGAILFWILLRFRILDIVPFARDMLFREMDDGVLVLDTRGRIVNTNPAAEAALGVTQVHLGRPAEEILKAWPGLPEHCRNNEEAEPPISLETSLKGKWFDVRISPLRGIRGRLRGKLLVFRDIGARKRMESELLQYATIDTLTGVYNRRMGLTIFEQQLRLSERNGTHLTICFVDINDLKSVNDNFGHAEGDFLIRTVASALKETLRDSDILCRLGGDEFLIILPDCTMTHARTVFNRAAEKLEALQKQGGKPFPFRVANGFAEYVPGLGVSSDDLLSQADAAMYRHKEGMKGIGAGHDAPG